MRKPVANPPRLSALPDRDDSAGIGRMFRNARDLADEELPTLRWRLRTSVRLRALRPRLILRAALVVGVVFCTGGLVGAVVSPFLARKEPAAMAPKSAPATSPGRRQPRPQPRLPTAAKPEPEAPAPPAPAKHRSVAMLAEPVPPPAPADAAETVPAPAPPSAIAVEQALLGQAIKHLRDRHDAAAALALLAQHAERFPQGTLTSETTMVRIEALLALGRRGEALAVLDGLALDSLPNRDEQLVVRGELRAAHGRWREASQDFDDTLRDHDFAVASARGRNLEERALWGRASARSRIGDQDGARADLELYLRRFPDGRFAGPAASLLKAPP